MSILVLQIPPRTRLRPDGTAVADTLPDANTEYLYALSDDGLGVKRHGQLIASLLPRADTVVAVLADTDVSWHRVALPKAPASKLRTALVGVLEDALLEDPALIHLAVAPVAVPGQPTWIAAVREAWLRTQLAALERSQVFVDRVVPSSWPDDPPCGHFAETEPGVEATPRHTTLTWAHADGVATLSLHGALARAVVPQTLPEGTRWSATPAAAAIAEQWVGSAVAVMTPAQRLLQAARSLWNLRQFDLARRSRGTRAFVQALRRVTGAAWRPARWGAVALVAANIVGLNLWAWHQRAEIEAKRAEAQRAIKTAFPNLGDNDIKRAGVQVMRREVDMLRQRAGQPGERDLEPMLHAAAAVWPPDRPPVAELRFEGGQLSMSVVGWDAPHVAQFTNGLQQLGWKVDRPGEGRLAMTRGDGRSVR